MAIISYGDRGGTEDIFLERGGQSAEQTLPSHLWRKAFRLLTYLDKPRCIEHFKRTPNFHLEALKKELTGYWSVRIDPQFRIIFKYDRANDNAYNVYIDDYH